MKKAKKPSSKKKPSKKKPSKKKPSSKKHCKLETYSSLPGQNNSIKVKKFEKSVYNYCKKTGDAQAGELYKENCKQYANGRCRKQKICELSSFGKRCRKVPNSVMGEVDSEKCRRKEKPSKSTFFCVLDDAYRKERKATRTEDDLTEQQKVFRKNIQRAKAAYAQSKQKSLAAWRETVRRTMRENRPASENESSEEESGSEREGEEVGGDYHIYTPVTVDEYFKQHKDEAIDHLYTTYDGESAVIYKTKTAWKQGKHDKENYTKWYLTKKNNIRRLAKK